MDPVTWTVIGVLAALGAGFGAGWGLKPDGAAKALEQQAVALEAVQEGNRELVAEVQAVALQEAERELQVSTALTAMPPQCIPSLGGDPMGVECAWAWCVRTGETNAQRCEQGRLMDQLGQTFEAREACPEAPLLPPEP